MKRMASTPRPASERGLLAALLALAAVYALWFRDDRHLFAALLLFALPPLLLALLVWARRRHAVFWSGVVALLWFSHGVMAAWVHPDARGWALLAIALSLAIVLAASWPGLAARARRRRR
jgi:uncharacterized membrane protein